MSTTYVLTTCTITGTEVSYAGTTGHKPIGVLANPANKSQIILIYSEDFTPTSGTKLTLQQFLTKRVEWLSILADLPEPEKVVP